ncbi:alpha/beta fold hydrolase, partial [Luminiphilus syltensis]|uniref:alpha/beta fold hydrolase n=1 Tax=Luminiphilus syltensis TaxID=1341119 RepID=UPI0018A84D46
MQEKQAIVKPLVQDLEVPVSGGVIALQVHMPERVRGPALICVHGWTLDRTSFLPQLALVDRGIPVVLYDRRGFGDNPLPPDLSREADDLEAILQALAMPAVIFGVSQGARLALRYAASERLNAAGIVIQGGHLDGVALDDLPGEVSRIRYLDLIKQRSGAF